MSTHALHVILAHQISSEGEEDDQEEERNPNIDAHQPRLFNLRQSSLQIRTHVGF
jgi:hypothetical protein